MTDTGLPPTELRSGELLAGKYRLVRPLAIGGMGQVWAARNLTTDADVAAKILLPTHASAEGLARFRREARATGALSHRAIVRVFDLIELDPARGSLVMVMELLRGQTLCDRLEHMGVLSVEETLSIVFPLLSGLAHAHGLGIVHRDLKPENIFLALEPDGQRLPKIVDFGISKLIREHPITLDGQIVGTVNYMSPEQTTGGEVDARSDVFSLAILLYECLSGRNPFEGPHEGACGIPNFMSVLEMDPRPLDGIPPALWYVIRRALAKNVDERFPSADDFARSLAAAAPALCAPPDICSATTTMATTPRVRSPLLSRGLAAGAILTLVSSLAFISPTNADSAPREQHAEEVGASTHAKHVAATSDRIRPSPEPAADAAFSTSNEQAFASAGIAENDPGRQLVGASSIATRRHTLRAVGRRAGLVRDPGF
jgi:eukaryotic-like serine/threonine-protein kinase